MIVNNRMLTVNFHNCSFISCNVIVPYSLRFGQLAVHLGHFTQLNASIHMMFIECSTSEQYPALNLAKRQQLKKKLQTLDSAERSRLLSADEIIDVNDGRPVSSFSLYTKTKPNYPGHKFCHLVLVTQYHKTEPRQSNTPIHPPDSNTVIIHPVFIASNTN